MLTVRGRGSNSATSPSALLLSGGMYQAIGLANVKAFGGAMTTVVVNPFGTTKGSHGRNQNVGGCFELFFRFFFTGESSSQGF